MTDISVYTDSNTSRDAYTYVGDSATSRSHSAQSSSRSIHSSDAITYLSGSGSPEDKPQTKVRSNGSVRRQILSDLNDNSALRRLATKLPHLELSKEKAKKYAKIAKIPSRIVDNLNFADESSDDRPRKYSMDVHGGRDLLNRTQYSHFTSPVTSKSRSRQALSSLSRSVPQSQKT
eukprot:UN23788